MGEGGSVQRRFGPDVDGAGAALPGPMNEVGGRIDGAGGADDQHQRGFSHLFLDAIHFEGNLAEEDNVRTQAASTRATADLARLE